MLYHSFRKPARIDPEILRTMKMVQNVGYAPNPGNKRRNQIPYVLPAHSQSQSKSNIPDSPQERGNKSGLHLMHFLVVLNV